MCDINQELNNFVGGIGHALGQVGKTVSSIGNAAVNTLDNIAHNPLPTIETAALMAVGVPPPIASAAVSAANGGSIEQIAINAAAAYGATQVGQAAGNAYSPDSQVGPLPADENLIKQIVTASSGTAAIAAFKGGNFQDVLQAGLSGSVGSLVANQLQSVNIPMPDSKILSAATTAATKAILQGKSVSDAIGSSVASATTSMYLGNLMKQVTDNNAANSTYTSKFNDLKQTAQDWYDNNKIDSLQKTAQQQYEAATAAQNTYSDLKSQFETQYATYQDSMKKYGSSGSEEDFNAADAAAKALSDLSPKYDAAAKAVGAATDTYQTTMQTLAPLQAEFTKTYADPLNNYAKLIDANNTKNTELSGYIGTAVQKYETDMQSNMDALTAKIADQAVTEAKDLLQKQAETPAPAEPTPASAEPTPAPAEPTPAPAEPTPAPAEPTPAEPAPAEPAPAQPTPEQTAADLQAQKDADAQSSIVRQAFGMSVADFEKYQALTPEQQSTARDLMGQQGLDPTAAVEQASAEPTPAEPTPAEPTPAEPTPAEPTPAEPTPAEPTPTEPTPAEPTPAEPAPEESVVDPNAVQQVVDESQQQAADTYANTEGPTEADVPVDTAPVDTTPAPSVPIVKAPTPAPTPAPAKAADTAAPAASNNSLAALLALLGSQQSVQQGSTQYAPPPLVDIGQQLDIESPLQTNPFAKQKTPTKMARGGSIDDLLAILKRG
jgi:hypothetical protein